MPYIPLRTLALELEMRRRRNILRYTNVVTLTFVEILPANALDVPLRFMVFVLLVRSDLLNACFPDEVRLTVFQLIQLMIFITAMVHLFTALYMLHENYIEIVGTSVHSSF